MGRNRSIAGLTLLLLLFPITALTESYRIGPGDLLMLRVLEWQPLENRTVEWEAMRGELPVDSDGMVNVPFIGQISAQSLPPAQLGKIVTERLQERLGISSSLDAVVSVETYQPVYISGAIRNPGQYPFRPGLTAIQLIAQSGGSALDQGGTIDARDMLNREGSMSLLSLEGERLTIRRAMLQAAIDGQDEVALPAAPEGGAWPQQVVESENEVLRLRRQRRVRELAALDDQILLLNNEVEALVGRSEALERLQEIAQREYENVQSLAQRGLAAGARVAETERSIALAEAQLLDISTAMLRARQGITLAEAEKVALGDRELIEDTRELQQVEENLGRVLTGLDTQQRISLAETGMFVREGMLDDDPAPPDPIVTIRRATDGEMISLSGLESLLEPGDVVEVTMPRIRGRWSQQLSGAVTQ